MPVIPRTQETGQLAMQNQPLMPIDALSGPGRALQSLGGAISGLQGAFEAASEPSDADKTDMELRALRANNNSQKYITESEATVTDDTDLDEYRHGTVAGVGESWDKEGEGISHPKLKQKYNMLRERFVGEADVRLHRYSTELKTDRNNRAAIETFKGTLRGVDVTTPEGKATLDAVSDRLRRLPGMDAEKAEKILAEEIIGTLAADPPSPEAAVEQADKAEGIAKSWGDELRAPPEAEVPGAAPAEQAPAVGAPPGAGAAPGAQPAPPIKPELGTPEKQSQAEPIQFADPPLTRTASRGTRDPSTVMGIVFHQTWGSDNMRGNGSWSNEKNTGAHYYIAKDGKVYNWAGDDVVMRHIQGGRDSSDNKRPDLTDKNAIGVEIMTRPNERPNPKQIAVATALARQLAEKYGLDPTKDAYGHGELTRKNYRRSDEAIEVVEALRSGAPQMALGGPGSASDGKGLKIDATAYSPQKGGDKMEGGYAAAGAGPNQDPKDSKTWKVSTLADVAAGRADYVTVAGDKAHFGKSYTIPEISFVDKDGKTQTLKNVKAVVHDTGSAFKGKPEGRYDIPIDRDATDKQMAASHSMWKKSGLQFMPGEQAVAEAAPEAPKPVAERSFTSFYGLTKPGSTATPEQGKIPGEAVAEQATADTKPGERGENAIPGPAPTQTADASGLTPEQFIERERAARAAAKAREVAAPPPKWSKSSIRSKVVEGLAKVLPHIQERRTKAIDGMVKRFEGVAGDGVMLPDEESEKMHAIIMRSGTPEQKQRYASALGTAEFRHKIKALPPSQVNQIGTSMRAQVVAGGSTPEGMALVEAVEKQAKRGAEMLGSDPYTYAVEAGVLPSKGELRPETMSIDALKARGEQRKTVMDRYGDQYDTFFDPTEKEWMGNEIIKGGSTAKKMLAMFYEAYGEDMPKAIEQISPKNPELAQAAYLFGSGGDPDAVDAIMETVERRADPNYKENVKLPPTADLETDLKSVFGNALDSFKPNVRDKITRGAEAIYRARTTDKANFQSDQFRNALKQAAGEHTVVRDNKSVTFGGVVKVEANWIAEDRYMMLPPTVRQDKWREAFATIEVGDLDRAGAARPADPDGRPIPMSYILENGKLVQEEGTGRYSIAMGDPDEPGNEQWIYGIDGQPLILDMEKLVPLLRPRAPHLFSEH